MCNICQETNNILIFDNAEVRALLTVAAKTTRLQRARAAIAMLFLSGMRDDLKLLCNLANIPYLSPHKLRHGHIVYARSLATTMDKVKAISQNVMHANVIITDQIYSGLVTDRVRDIISTLGASPSQPQGKEIILAQIAELLKQL